VVNIVSRLFSLVNQPSNKNLAAFSLTRGFHNGAGINFFGTLAGESVGGSSPSPTSLHYVRIPNKHTWWRRWSTWKHVYNKLMRPGLPRDRNLGISQEGLGEQWLSLCLPMPTHAASLWLGWNPSFFFHDTSDWSEG
jgi:hypothetical protein